MADEYVVDATFHGDTRRVYVKSMRFDDLVEALQAGFNNRLDDPITVVYVDEENDTCTVGNHNELQEAFRVAAATGSVLAVTVIANEVEIRAPLPEGVVPPWLADIPGGEGLWLSAEATLPNICQRLRELGADATLPVEVQELVRECPSIATILSGSLAFLPVAYLDADEDYVDDVQAFFTMGFGKESVLGVLRSLSYAEPVFSIFRGGGGGTAGGVETSDEVPRASEVGESGGFFDGLFATLEGASKSLLSLLGEDEEGSEEQQELGKHDASTQN